MITDNRQITEHFHSSEFRCQHCGNIYIQEELVKKMEILFKKLNASKCIISSGYRCREYDIQIGGFAGRHSEGLAADCVYYDENGNIIPSKIVICVAWDMKLLNGIANIDGNYSHLDNRKNGTYYGDEPRGNSSMWSNPYSYFGVSKEEVRQYTKEGETGHDTTGVITYQVYTDMWYSEVSKVDDTPKGYAGLFGDVITGFRCKPQYGTLTYEAHLLGGDWIGAVNSDDYANGTLNGYAGIYGKPIDGIRIKSSQGWVKYRVHIKDGDWLPWAEGFGDSGDEYAGIYGKEIDGIQMY